MWLSGQRIHSLLCFESSPKILLKHQDFSFLEYQPSSRTNGGPCISSTFRRLISPRCMEALPFPSFFSFLFSYKSEFYLVSCIPTHDLLVPWDTFQISIQMMSGLTSHRRVMAKTDARPSVSQQLTFKYCYSLTFSHFSHSHHLRYVFFFLFWNGAPETQVWSRLV